LKKPLIAGEGLFCVYLLKKFVVSSMQPLPLGMLNPSIAELVAAGALFVVNHSGGKDSQLLYRTVKAQVPAAQLVIIHADLGRVEWPGLKAHIRANTDDVPMYVTRNLKKDLLSMADERGMFPSPKYRQCTSDLKRAPIERQIRQLTPAKGDGSKWLVVDCIGQRAQESKDRSKLKPFERHGKNCNGVREWYIWRPIHGASIDEVWASEGHTAEELEQRRALWRAGRKDEAVAGWGFHWAYVAGMSRLSCSFCIMSTKADIQVAGRERPDLLAEYDAIERKHDVTMMMPQGGKRLFLTDIVAMADADVAAEGCGACGGGCTSEPEIETLTTTGETVNFSPLPTIMSNTLMQTLSQILNGARRLETHLSALRALAPEPSRKTVIVDLKRPPVDYFGAPVLSNSRLSHPDGLDVKESTLRLGTLVHAGVYEPAVFEASAEYKAHLAGLPGNCFNLAPDTVTENDKLMRHVLAMRDSALKCPVLASMLKRPEAEVELETFALLWGVIPVKVKLDLKVDKSGHDLKTTACRSRAEFVSKFDKYGYWRQAVLYKEVHGLKNFYFTGVSKSAPHDRFLVDTSQYKAEMKTAKIELENMLIAHLTKYPEYITESLSFLESCNK
jgi:DNA sulfur modification protein DndC